MVYVCPHNPPHYLSQQQQCQLSNEFSSGEFCVLILKSTFSASVASSVQYLTSRQYWSVPAPKPEESVCAEGMFKLVSTKLVWGLIAMQLQATELVLGVTYPPSGHTPYCSVWMRRGFRQCCTLTKQVNGSTEQSWRNHQSGHKHKYAMCLLSEYLSKVWATRMFMELAKSVA